MKEDIQSIFQDLWRQNPPHHTISTMNWCDGCEGHVRGTGLCSNCIIKEAGLSPAKTEELRLYLSHIKEIRKIEKLLSK